MNWVFSDKVFLYDGSIDGFLTIVCNVIFLKEMPRIICSETLYEDNLIDMPIFIKTDLDKGTKLLQELAKLSDITLYNIYTAFLSGHKEKEIMILKYIINALKYGNKLDYMQNKQCVVDIRMITRRVTGEAHLLKGFLRFREITNNILYGEIEPDNNVLELLVKHFKRRMPKENWVIHDKKRHLMALYDTKQIYFGSAESLKLNNSDGDQYEKIWKDYFKNIAIKERTNKRCQMNLMPKKYWKYMLEVEGEI